MTSASREVDGRHTPPLIIRLSLLILDTAGTSGEMGNWGEASLLFLTSRLNIYRVNMFTMNIYRVNIFTASIYQVQPDRVYIYWVNIFRVGSTFIARAFRIFCTSYISVFQSLQSYGFRGFGHWVGHGVGNWFSLGAGHRVGHEFSHVVGHVVDHLQSSFIASEFYRVGIELPGKLQIWFDTTQNTTTLREIFKN